MHFKELKRAVRLRCAESLPGLFRLLPETWGREVCVGIGLLAYVVVGRDRRLARANLARVHPEWSTREIERASRRVFRELGRNAYDFLRYAELDASRRERLVRLEGREALDAPRRRGEGALLVTGHLGCFEILAATLAREGYPFKAMARPLREEGLERALSGHRRRMGVETISSFAPREALRHLKAGGYLGLLADQRVKEGGVRVTFMGQPTRMTDGPARLALAAGVPVIPFGIRRTQDHSHRVLVLPAFRPTRERTPAHWTQAIAGSLERLIRSAPEQWMWMHPRWEPGAATGPRRFPEASKARDREAACASS